MLPADCNCITKVKKEIFITLCISKHVVWVTMQPEQVHPLLTEHV